MSLYKLSWAIWIPGTLLIFLSWGNVVSPKVGNIGWWMAMAGAVLSFIPSRRSPKAPAGQKPSTALSDLDTLARLREKGDLTEEEYQRQRSKRLGDSGPKA